LTACPSAAKIRQFRKNDTREVLGLANGYAAFDGTTSEEGLATNFPGGFWVAEDDGRLVGSVHGHVDTQA
jgi:N-acetylglutamate synthase-like GNAT family acetyltransferase